MTRTCAGAPSQIRPMDARRFATPSAWYSFTPPSQLHEILPSDPIQATSRGRPDSSLLFGLRRVLNPKPACSVIERRTRHRSKSPTQADGYMFIVIDPVLLRIGQKVTSVHGARSLRASGQGDGRRGPRAAYGHLEAPFDRIMAGAEGLAGGKLGPCPGREPARRGARHPIDLGPRSSHMSLSPPRRVPLGDSHWSRYFGGPANSESPVALRPPLTRSLPFGLLNGQMLNASGT
jgi:hypothetical protein